MSFDDEDEGSYSIGDGVACAAMWIALAASVWALAWCTVNEVQL